MKRQSLQSGLGKGMENNLALIFWLDGSVYSQEDEVKISHTPNCKWQVQHSSIKITKVEQYNCGYHPN